MERNTLQGKVIAITGGSSGIGLATVKKLIILKAKVAVADIQACPDEVSSAPDVHFTKVDVTSREEVHNWVQNVVSKYGRLDGMVANAGIAPPEGEVASDEIYQMIFSVCCTGVWNCGTEAYWQFKKQGGGGVVVTTSSIGAMRHSLGLSVYGAAKSAVIGFTQGWAVEWAGQGIRVNCVAPGATITPLQQSACGGSPGVMETFTSKVPLGRLGVPEELADAFIFLLGDSASYVSGQVLSVDGALTVSG